MHECLFHTDDEDADGAESSIPVPPMFLLPAAPAAEVQNVDAVAVGGGSGPFKEVPAVVTTDAEGGGGQYEDPAGLSTLGGGIEDIPALLAIAPAGGPARDISAAGGGGGGFEAPAVMATASASAVGGGGLDVSPFTFDLSAASFLTGDASKDATASLWGIGRPHTFEKKAPRATRSSKKEGRGGGGNSFKPGVVAKRTPPTKKRTTVRTAVRKKDGMPGGIGRSTDDTRLFSDSSSGDDAVDDAKALGVPLLSHQLDILEVLRNLDIQALEADLVKSFHFTNTIAGRCDLLTYGLPEPRRSRTKAEMKKVVEEAQDKFLSSFVSGAFGLEAARSHLARLESLPSDTKRRIESPAAKPVRSCCSSSGSGYLAAWGSVVLALAVYAFVPPGTVESLCF